jgi:hypothetical protein
MFLESFLSRRPTVSTYSDNTLLMQLKVVPIKSLSVVVGLSQVD